MRTSTVCGAVLALASLAAVILAGVSVNELNYVSDHPYAYGPAKVIAWAAAGGVLLAIAIGLLAWVMLRPRSEPC
jgi:peptidoglycan/LPS O-acetylase OafA/YrhL